MCQDYDKRSMSTPAKAVGRDPSTIRNWSLRHGWAAREKELGVAGQAAALAVYRAEYVGRVSAIELDAVKPKISVPVHPADTAAGKDLPPSESVQEGRHGPAHAPDNRPGHAADRSKPKLSPARQKEAEVLRKGILITDALIGTLANAISDDQNDRKAGGKGGRVKVKPADLPALINKRVWLERDLEKIESGVDPLVSATNVEIPESYRVKAARAAGDNQGIMAAIAADAQDLAIAFGAIANQSTQDVQNRRGPVEVAEEEAESGAV